MEFTCPRDTLAKAVAAVQRVVPARGPLPILSSLLIVAENNRLRLSATDLEIGLELQVEALVNVPGAMAVPAKRLSEILGKLPNTDVSMSVVDEHKAQILCARSRFVLPILPADEFPAIPHPTKAKKAASISLPQGLLAKAIKQTAYCAAKDDKTVISSIHVQVKGDVIEIAGTDGYRLAVFTTHNVLGSEFEANIPVRAINELSKFSAGWDGEVEVTLMKSTGSHAEQAVFVFGDRYMTSRIADGQYPPYHQIIPAAFSTTITCDRLSLLHAVERVALMASEREAKCIQFTVTAGNIHLSCNTIDLGQGDEDLEAEAVIDDSLSISFNAAYLIETLKALDGESALMKCNGPLMPAIFETTTDEQYKALVMPIRS